MKRITKEKRQELRNLAKLLAVMGVRNNTDLEDLHVLHISDKEMRSLMLSVERALEMALCSYEALNPEEKKVILKSIMTQRSYDRPKI